MRRRLPALLAIALLAAGCAGGDGGEESPGPGPTVAVGSPPATVRAPTPTPDPGTPEGRGPSYSDRELGAHPLPVRPDGLGQMSPTPPQLRQRRFPTIDLLPPPPDGGFHAEVGPVTRQVRDRMGRTWTPDCPVRLAELRYVTVTFRG